jgi:PPOX class probable F420-dependent enzyme
VGGPASGDRRTCHRGGVRLDEDECWRRLAAAHHAVLGTTHPDRGPDLVPVVFAVPRLGDGERSFLIPVDTVKPKAGGRLQRLVNLERDSRCTLLAEHYDDDWQQLWWVRVHAEAAEVEPSADQLALLAERYEPYREPGSITSVLVLRPTHVHGWAAAG